MSVRINKYLSEVGYCSRRVADRLIGEGKVLINGIEIEKKRVDSLTQLNFISPYVELPKKLTVKQNLEVYGRLYDVKNLKIKIQQLSEKLRLNEIKYN